MSLINPMLQLSQFVENGNHAIYEFIGLIRAWDDNICYTRMLHAAFYWMVVTYP